MSPSQRLFVGIALPKDVRAELDRTLVPQREAWNDVAALRWIAPEQWHLTLQFLGSVADERVGAVSDACRTAGSHVPAFELALCGAGAFRSPRSASVLWAGVTEGASAVADLAAAVMLATAPLGFPGEARPYHAHLTLARIKPPADLRAKLPMLHIPALQWRAAELVLFRSHLGPKGARYEPVQRHALEHRTP